MVKRILNLYVEDELIKQAKQTGVNISGLLTKMLAMQNDESDEFYLKVELSKAKVELEELRNINEQLKKKNDAFEDRINKIRTNAAKKLEKAMKGDLIPIYD